MFGFNKAQYDLNRIKPYFLPNLDSEKGIEPTVIIKANQIISFNFGDIHLMDILIFQGDAASLDSFLKEHKTFERKRFFTNDWFHRTVKMQNSELTPYDAFYTKLPSCSHFEAEDIDQWNKLLLN